MEELNILSPKYLQYQGVNSAISAIVDGIPVSIPIDPANRYYQEIMKLVEAGELTIQAADEE